MKHVRRRHAHWAPRHNTPRAATHHVHVVPSVCRAPFSVVAAALAPSGSAGWNRRSVEGSRDRFGPAQAPAAVRSRLVASANKHAFHRSETAARRATWLCASACASPALELACTRMNNSRVERSRRSSAARRAQGTALYATRCDLPETRATRLAAPATSRGRASAMHARSQGSSAGARS